MNNISEEKMHHRADPGYKHRIAEMPGGDTLRFCYQCGSCTANCPLARLIGVYRPNKMLELAKLGIRNIPQSNAFLLCSACTQCTKGCPQGVNVHEFMNALKRLAANDESARDLLLSALKDSLAELSKAMPFPVSYGWICMMPAEEEIDNGAFSSLAREVLMDCLADPVDKTKPVDQSLGKAAVIGSGPAGLTAAWELCKAGVPVTVFEPLSVAGGMLAAGIPSYRLPNDIVAAEVQKIEALGAEIKTNTPVDKALFERLVGEYKTVFVATGAHTARNLRIDGEDLDGVVTALDFLREFNLSAGGKTPPLQSAVGKKVVVIGGGNVGIDAARTALRCGAESVELFCLESREEMPSHEWEINEAAAEGVTVNPSWGPRAIIGEGGKVTGVELVRCKSVFDKSGKFSPEFDEKTTRTVEADMVIPAIGQAPALDFLSQMVETQRGTISADPLTMETSLPGVFAGGDTVSGTASLIEAIIAGKTAAASMLRYLREGKI